MHTPPHPGEILKELYLEPLGLTITETAEGLGITRKTLSELVNYKANMSPEMAIRLSIAFDTTPEMWMNLQKTYTLWKSKDNVDTTRIKHFFHAETL
jgi:addiction module HigA family antidote